MHGHGIRGGEPRHDEERSATGLQAPRSGCAITGLTQVVYTGELRMSVLRPSCSLIPLPQRQCPWGCRSSSSGSCTRRSRGWAGPPRTQCRSWAPAARRSPRRSARTARRWRMPSPGDAAAADLAAAHGGGHDTLLLAAAHAPVAAAAASAATSAAAGVAAPAPGGGRPVCCAPRCCSRPEPPGRPTGR